MKKPVVKKPDELRPEYDLREFLKHAVRGKHVEAYGACTNLVRRDEEGRSR
jgi:hypothetical protein